MHVYDSTVEKRNLQIFINENLLRPQIHDLRRLPQRSLHLVGSHPHLDRLRFGLRLLLSALTLSTALGHPIHPERALLKASERAVVTDTADAEALGRRAAAALSAQGADEYLKDV